MLSLSCNGEQTCQQASNKAGDLEWGLHRHGVYSDNSTCSEHSPFKVPCTAAQTDCVSYIIIPGNQLVNPLGQQFSL